MGLKGYVGLSTIDDGKNADLERDWYVRLQDTDIYGIDDNRLLVQYCKVAFWEHNDRACDMYPRVLYQTVLLIRAIGVSPSMT